MKNTSTIAAPYSCFINSRFETHLYDVQQRIRPNLFLLVVLKRQRRDNAKLASNACTNSSYESGGRPVAGAAKYQFHLCNEKNAYFLLHGAESFLRS